MANLTFNVHQVAELVNDAQSREVLSLDQAAERFDTEPAELERLASQELLPGRKIGETYVFLLADLVSWHLRALQRLSPPAGGNAFPELY